MNFAQVVDHIRSSASTERQKGALFEEFIRRCWLTDPQFGRRTQNIWLWQDFPGRESLGGKDLGIDLVAEMKPEITGENEFWAIQCKCYDKNSTIDKKAVDSFLSNGQRLFDLSYPLCQAMPDISPSLSINGERRGENTKLPLAIHGEGDGGRGHFSRFIWIDTGCKWNANAEESIRGRSNFTRLNGNYFDAQRTDYRPLLEGRQTVEPPKTPRPHQIEAIEKTLAHFKENNRGQLIMACGTGKTLTSLRIAEAICAQPDTTKLVLYLVPSIALLGQAYNAWAADTTSLTPSVAVGDISPSLSINGERRGENENTPSPFMERGLGGEVYHASLYAIGVCSDPHATEKRRKSTKDNLFDQTFDNLCDVPLSASTNPERVAQQLMAYYQAPRDFKEDRMCVVFSTYQSIEVVEEAQKRVLEQTQNRFGTFEICFCDEAHRTTQACAKAESTPSFVHVHDENKIHIKKRLYMTATPRIYSESAKSNAKAKNSDVLIASMDDETVFGPEIHRISFNDAVQKGLLTDYKVIVLTASPKDLPESIHDRIDDPNATEIDTDIATKLYGTTLALSKQITGDEGKTWQDDPQTCRRALLFANVIGDEELTGSSKNVAHIFESISDAVVAAHPSDHIVHVECEHVDGSMGANERYRLLEWLDTDLSYPLCQATPDISPSLSINGERRGENTSLPLAIHGEGAGGRGHLFDLSYPLCQATPDISPSLSINGERREENTSLPLAIHGEGAGGERSPKKISSTTSMASCTRPNTAKHLPTISRNRCRAFRWSKKQKISGHSAAPGANWAHCT